MLRSRVIPCLLMRNNGLVKTVQFDEGKYVGDPINAVRIFNEKEADELIVLDIDASVQGREPDFAKIAHLAAECRMPLCYGGGVKTADQVTRIMSLGVEKVAISSGLIENPNLVRDIAVQVGNQSVVAVLDVKKVGREHRVFIFNGKKDTRREPIPLAKELEAMGIGEIVLNSIDRDGMMKGYDLELIDALRKAVRVPITVMGGAGSLADIRGVIQAHGPIGVAAGSLFVFKGVYRAVLINYPSQADRDALHAAG